MRARGSRFEAWLLRILDGCISAGTIQEFISRTIRSFGDHPPAFANMSGAPWFREDMRAVAQLISEFGLPYPCPWGRASGVEDPPTLSRTPMEWFQGLEGNAVVGKDGLRSGAGAYLEQLLLSGEEACGESIKTELERLLRHVEVKRDLCLSPIVPAVSWDQAWVEKHRVAILFARHARRAGDLRFLNTALKLNDWAFSSHRKMNPRHHAGPLMVYLRSLVEQEAACKELLAR